MFTHLRSVATFLLMLSIHSALLADDANCVPSNECARASISDFCDAPCIGCTTTNVSSFFAQRSITQDLTLRNDTWFYQKYHDGSEFFLGLDWTFLYQQNRNASCIGLGFFGQNPITFAEMGGNVESLNFSLGSYQPQGFFSTCYFAPKRKVFAWIPQFFFNFGPYIGWDVWFNMAFAVTHVRHQACLDEYNSYPGEIPAFISVSDDEVTTVASLVDVNDAFNYFAIFPDYLKYTLVDNIELSLGFDFTYRGNDHVGPYVLVDCPTGKRFDNTYYWQPLIGSQNWGVGFGFTADATLLEYEANQSNLCLMTDFRYMHFFANKDLRVYDLTPNGPLSRFLLMVTPDTIFAPVMGIGVTSLCTRIQPGDTFQWWIGLHYQYCTWGFEVAYDLWVRKCEKLSLINPDLGGYGIYDLTRCTSLTTHSTATIADVFGEGTPDAVFTPIPVSDINVSSANAGKGVSNSISAMLSYGDYWRYYPYNASFGVRYEDVPKKHTRTTLQNWTLFGKLSISV